jgi:ABC-type transporter Mla subunit MlaD
VGERQVGHAGRRGLAGAGLLNGWPTSSSTFDRLQPQLEQAFQAVGPLIDSLTGSLSRAAETAMPALVRSVQAAGPVFDGLGHAVEAIAQGLAGFFDNISAHSGAAGQAMAAIGDIIGTAAATPRRSARPGR